MIDNSHARTNMAGYYGYGGDTIGHITWKSNFSLNGAQMRSYSMAFVPDNGVQDVHISGMLLHGSHYDKGLEVDGTYEEVSKGNVSAYESVGWGGTGYYSYSRSYLNHAHVMEVAWEESSVPQGYWYAYIKSLVAEDPNNDDIYAFRDETYLFEDSADGGFHNY